MMSRLPIVYLIVLWHIRMTLSTLTYERDEKATTHLSAGGLTHDCWQCGNFSVKAEYNVLSRAATTAVFLSFQHTRLS